jgi:uncharacterized membrane protein YfcA
MPASFDIVDAQVVFGIFFAAGVVKGIAGFGLPAISLGLLALTRPLPEALPLILLPTIATNVWQAFAGGALGLTLSRLWSFFLAAALGTLAAAGMLSRVDAMLLTGLLGILLMVSSALALVAPRWPVPSPRSERLLSPLMGVLSGILVGLTGSFIMPAAPWLTALRLSPSIFVQSLGLGALLTTICLSAAMASQGLIPPHLALVSCAVLIPAFLGMSLGRQIRLKLPEQRFRIVVQIFLLALGSYLGVRSFGP